MAAEDGLPCPVCMFMLGQLLAQIQDPSNQATIEAGALQVLPPPCPACKHALAPRKRLTFPLS